MVKLFFISYGGGHAKMLIPVIKSLPKDIDYTYLALNTAINDATQEGIRFNTLLDYKNLFSDERIELYGERLLIENHSKGLNISKELSKFSLGLNYLDLVLTHGEEFAEKMYQLKNRQAFLPIQHSTNVCIYYSFQVSHPVSNVSCRLRTVLLFPLPF